jgi:ribose 5-phosphate isomerase B
MEIIIGADHRGFELKEILKDWLVGEGHTVTDVSAPTLTDGDDYPDYAFKVAQAVAEKGDDGRGIVLCGSGAGMAVAADKIPGIRAALIHDAAIAQAARHDDNINVLALGADYIGPEDAKKVVLVFLTTPFANQEKYQRRLQKIHAQEGHG